MSCQQVDFILGTCLVEINIESGGQPLPAYTVFISLLEGNGTVIRPLVGPDGRRVRIRAGSEPVALTSAISYLKARLGRPRDEGHPCTLSDATVGRPIPIG